MQEPVNPTKEEPVFSRKVLEMITVANEFCLFLEKAEEYSDKELIAFLHKILPLIYLKAALIPEVDVSDEDATEHYVTEEQWEGLFNALRQKFGKSDEFTFIDHAESSHSDPVNGSISECLTDIYQDLKDFLLLYQKPLRTFKENAVRECRKLFETRFGPRIAQLTGPLHFLQYPAEMQDYND